MASLVTAVFALQVSAGAQDGTGTNPQAGRLRVTKALPSPKEKINAWTVGLAGGLLEGAPIRLAAEIARVVDDGDNLHVLPIVTRGPTENLNSLLYLRGVDMAIINADALDEYKIYLPATLEASEYPGLIQQGERIATIAVPTALIAFNWPPGSNRYQRVARFVDHLFGRIDRLQGPGFDPKWKAINLAATVPGLSRFQAAQDWLNRGAANRQTAR